MFWNNFYLFGCAGSLLLCGLFSSCREQGGSGITARGLPSEVASRGRMWAPGCADSGVGARGSVVWVVSPRAQAQ